MCECPPLLCPSGTAGSARQRSARCPLLWTVAGQYCGGAGEEEEEEVKAVGCSRCCPSWGGLSVRVMGLHPVSEAPDPQVWEGAPTRTGGMLGLCTDTAAFKRFRQPC